LVLLSPLIFLKLPLLLAFNPCEILNKLLLGLLIFGLLEIELLKLDDLIASSEEFLFLDSFDFLLTVDCLREHVSVAVFLRLKLLLTENFLSLIVTDKLHVSLAVKNMLLSLDLLLIGLFFLPLLVKHRALLFSQLAFLLFTLHSGVLLPVEYSKSISDSSLSLIDFSLFTLLLRFEIEFPKLGIDFLFNYLLLRSAFLVHKLLFTLHLTLLDKEFALLLSQIVSCCNLKYQSIIFTYCP